MKYLNDYKIFENSNISIDNFEEIYKKVQSVRNDGYAKDYSLDKESKAIPDKFLDHDEWLVLDLDEVVGEITEEDKLEIIKVYKNYFDRYKLSDLPDYEEIGNEFLRLGDITTVDITLGLDKGSLTYSIDMVPDVKTFPKSSIEFDINKFDEILMDVLAIVNRLREKYTVKTYLGMYGKIRILITR